MASGQLTPQRLALSSRGQARSYGVGAVEISAFLLPRSTATYYVAGDAPVRGKPMREIHTA